MHNGRGDAQKSAKYSEQSDIPDEPKSDAYCLHCNAWRGSLGLEPDYKLYLSHLRQIFSEVKRVLKRTGTLWVNLGDSYSGSGKGIGGDRTKCKEVYTDDDIAKSDWKLIDIPAKSLIGIPERFAIMMTDELGWIRRNTLIWHKPNCMPSSTNDRFTVDFEPIYFFVKSTDTQYWVNEKTGLTVSKQPKGTKGVEGIDWDWREVGNYEGTEIFNVRVRDALKEKYMQGATEDEIKNYRKGKRKKVSNWSGRDYWFEPQFEEYIQPLDRWGGDKLKADGFSKWNEGTGQELYRDRDMRPNPLGRNKRCVWRIPTEPYSEAHFATFPQALVIPMIQSGCPEYICKECGLPREKMYQEIKHEPIEVYNGQATKDYTSHRAQNPSDSKRRILESMRTEHKHSGYTHCSCPNPTYRPGIVLDIFAGSGTTLAVAERLGRKWIGVEISREYCVMAERRIAEYKIPLLSLVEERQSHSDTCDCAECVGEN